MIHVHDRIRALLFLSAAALVPACGPQRSAPQTPVPAYLTATQDDAPPAAAGHLDLGPSFDLIALYNGVVLIGDQTAHEIQAVNVVTGAIVDRFEVPAAPGAIAYDSERATLWVALPSADTIVGIDLIRRTQKTITVPTSPNSLTLGPGGKVFAALWGPPPGGIAIVDGIAGVLLTISHDAVGQMVLFNPMRSELLTGYVTGIINRYSYDDSTLKLSLVQQMGLAGENCQEMLLSPDAKHLAFMSGAGSGPDYSVDDWAPSDILSASGNWAVGPFPWSGAFSPDGTRLLTSNQSTLEVFDVATYAKLATYTPDLTGVLWPYLKRARYSRGGKTIFALTNYGTGSRLFWQPASP